MNNDPSIIPAYYRTAIWCLRITTALQCLGIAGRYLLATFETESPAYGLLFFNFGIPEYAAQFIDDLGVYCCLLASGSIILTGILYDVSKQLLSDQSINRLRSLDNVTLAFIVLWTLSMAIAETIRGDLFSRFTLLEEAVRIASPLALLLFLMTNRLAIGSRSHKWASIILLFATSTTFAIHGYKAIELYGPFVDFLLLSKPFGITIASNQQTAEAFLFVIGWVDIILAISIVVLRWQGIALYMAAWGFLTAFSRITAGGLDAWPELLIRSANAGAPLTLFFLLRGKSLCGFTKNNIRQKTNLTER
ncbi:hypothetical protein N9Z70_00040 [Mariniblastus sp.]|nr:hypothetical protein [Mariniblastus sp.]MDB4379753.1 hypothetical protein [Mariniblastus sp.]